MLLRLATTIMPENFHTIIIGGGAAGCVLANRLSARSTQLALDPSKPGRIRGRGASLRTCSILMQPPITTTPISGPASRSIGAARTTRRRSGFLEARLMGGGSSVMGMVAYCGAPEDYAEWEAHGAQGWGWTDVLPFFRKLEQDLDFDGGLTWKRRSGSHPTDPAAGLAAALQGGARLRAGAADPVHCRHERRLSRRLRRGAHEQLAGQTRLFGDLLSRCIGAGARQSHYHQRGACDRSRFRGRPGRRGRGENAW